MTTSAKQNDNLRILAERLPPKSLAKSITAKFITLPETEWEQAITDITDQLVQSQIGSDTTNAPEAS